MLILICKECGSKDLVADTLYGVYCMNCGCNSKCNSFKLENFSPESVIEKVKVTEYQGRLSPIYEELGEIEVFQSTLGWSGVGEEYCIDIDDLIEFIKYR